MAVRIMGGQKRSGEPHRTDQRAANPAESQRALRFTGAGCSGAVQGALQLGYALPHRIVRQVQ
jgi:hypothetical protein